MSSDVNGTDSCISHPEQKINFEVNICSVVDGIRQEAGRQQLRVHVLGHTWKLVCSVREFVYLQPFLHQSKGGFFFFW